MDNNFSGLNEKERVEWLVDRLITAEEERDSALDRLEEKELENLSLRGKLSAIGYILCGDDSGDDTEISDSDNIDIPDLF